MAKERIRILILYFLRIFIKELNYVNTNDIIAIGKEKFFTQYLKGIFYRRKGIYKIMPSRSKIIYFDNLIIEGELLNSNLVRSFISAPMYIQAINGIKLHSSVLIGPDVKIISANHNNKNYEIWDSEQSIVINENVWIGSNVVILPGVKIGKNSIIGAGSIVTKSFDENSLIGGNPAKLIRKV